MKIICPSIFYGDLSFLVCLYLLYFLIPNFVLIINDNGIEIGVKTLLNKSPIVLIFGIGIAQSNPASTSKKIKNIVKLDTSFILNIF